MSASALIMALLAAAGTAGVLIAVRGLTPTVPEPRPAGPSGLRLLARRLSPKAMGVDARNMAIGLAVGVIGAVVTRMVALVALAPLAALMLPALIGSPQGDRIARLQGLETWTRALSGVLVAGTGIEDAIRASLHSVPEVLRPSVTTLAARIRAGQALEPALRAWADEVDDQNADMIAAALIQGSQRRGGVAQALGELADVVSDRVRVAQQIEADRATPRTTVRAVTLISLGLLVVMLLANAAFRDAYSNPLGQAVFATLTGAYLGSLWWIRTIISRTPVTRFLTSKQVTAP